MKVPALRQVKATLPMAAPTLIALVLWVVVALVAVTAGWRQLELKLLDKLIVASAPNKSNYPITVVGIDAVSFAKLGLQWPWPRSLHAELLDRLAADGAAVVVFDVVFSEASGRGPEDDQRLADSIQHAGNVVLAADRIYRETAVTSEWQRLDPLPLFMKAGAQVGLATVPLDVDAVVRQVPTSGESMWRTTVLRLIRDHPELSPNLGTAASTNIRYVGGDRTFPYVSYHEVVKPTGSVPEGFFKDQVVIVGFAARASPNAQSAQADLFNTPFSGSTGGQMPGAEVHANLIETALSRNAISRLPDLAVVVLLGLVAALSAWTMRRWRPIHSALWGGGIAMVIAALVWGVMLWGNLWVPSASMLVLVALLYVSLGGRSYLLEQARRAEITRAFSLYVTPQVVEQMIAHPEQMRLGGERRNITIMFTDLAGFTTISEAHSAERVTYLLNRHFTAMTDIVLEHHGTVARFIGDAIMAFWGAPLEDDDQAYRAVAAAIAMQEGMNTLRADFAKEGLPPIHMRVGIHSGSAVVGNLGSAKRFDYTAIGDDVNLAARLEGTNKLYGTTILVSQETVNCIGGRLRFRPVDKVVVKGKSLAVETFAPCANEQVVDLTTRAIELFRGQQWDAAQLLFAELLGVAPGDQIAAIYQQRIAAFRATPPSADWDGAVELDKL